MFFEGLAAKHSTASFSGERERGEKSPRTPRRRRTGKENWHTSANDSLRKTPHIATMCDRILSFQGLAVDKVFLQSNTSSSEGAV